MSSISIKTSHFNFEPSYPAQYLQKQWTYPFLFQVIFFFFGCLVTQPIPDSEEKSVSSLSLLQIDDFSDVVMLIGIDEVKDVLAIY